MKISQAICGIITGTIYTILITWGIKSGKISTKVVNSTAWNAHATTASPGSIIYPNQHNQWNLEEIVAL